MIFLSVWHMIEVKLFFGKNSANHMALLPNQCLGPVTHGFIMPVINPNSNVPKLVSGSEIFQLFCNTVMHFRKTSTVYHVLCEQYRVFLGLNFDRAVCQDTLKIKKSSRFLHCPHLRWGNLLIYPWHVFNGTVKHLKLVTSFIFFAI